MIDPEILHKAARKGLLKPEQVEPLSDFINQQGNDTTAKVHDEEQLKFVRNFGDIFITLGVAFIALSVASMDLQSWQWWLATGCFVALAEWLVKQRRLALPGIAIFAEHHLLRRPGSESARYGSVCRPLFSHPLTAFTQCLFRGILLALRYAIQPVSTGAKPGNRGPDQPRRAVTGTSAAVQPHRTGSVLLCHGLRQPRPATAITLE